jgi:hypothetical protein
MTDTPTSEEERREAKVVSRHLPLGHSAEPDVDHGNAAASAPSLMQPRQESSKLLGGNVHHGPWVNLTRPGPIPGRRKSSRRTKKRGDAFYYKVVLHVAQSFHWHRDNVLTEGFQQRWNIILLNHFGDSLASILRMFLLAPAMQKAIRRRIR